MEQVEAAENVTVEVEEDAIVEDAEAAANEVEEDEIAEAEEDAAVEDEEDAAVEGEEDAAVEGEEDAIVEAEDETVEDVDEEEADASTLDGLTKTQKAESDAMLNPDPSLNPVFQRVAGKHLSLGGGVGMIMRNQVLSAYDAVEAHEQVLTTSEYRVKQDVERDAMIAIERAKLAALNVKPVRRVHATPDLRKPLEITASTAQPPMPTVVEMPGEPHATKPKKKRKSVEEKLIAELEKVEEPFVPLWEKYVNEGPPEVDVGSDAVPQRPPQESSGVKTYNSLVQVRPKDIAKVNTGLNTVENPGRKQYKIITSTIRLNEIDASSEDPLHGELSDPPFKNAYTQARPRGYKELDLGSVNSSTQKEEKEIEVTELDIERSVAASRGILLKEGNILWPNIVEFNSDLAKIKMKTYIRNFWKLGPEWMYDIRFVQTHTTNYRKKFIYEVIFSIPTNEFPVPPATASVFFVFEAEHHNCPDQAMKVHFILEGNRYPYKPGSVEFREDWLSGIIQDKLRIQKAIHF